MAVEFTKKYWLAKRDSSAQKSGVSEALLEWEKNCTDPKKFNKSEQFKSARDTAAKLSKALDAAKQKSAKHEGTQKIIAEYKTGIKQYLDKVEDAYTDNVADFIAVRKKLSTMAHQKLIQFENLMKTAQACVDECEDLEKEAANPGLTLEKKHSLLQELEMHLQKLKAAEGQMNKIEETTGQTMITLKGDNPIGHGVEAADCKEAEKYMLIATENMNTCSNLQKQMKIAVGEFEESSKEVKSLVFQEVKALQQSQANAKNLALAAETLLAELIKAVDMSTGNLKSLEELSKKATLTENEKKTVGIRLMDTKNRIAHVTTHRDKILLLSKQAARIPLAHKLDLLVRSGLKTVDNSIESANITKRSFDELVKSVATLAGQIAKIPTVN